MTDSTRWEGPGRVVVNGSLIFPGHASLWFRGDQWGGTLHIDTFAPLHDLTELGIELDLRDAGRRRVDVQDVTNVMGIASREATVVRFRGIDPLLRPRDMLAPGDQGKV
jgi:hypothetical protein